MLYEVKNSQIVSRTSIVQESNLSGYKVVVAQRGLDRPAKGDPFRMPSQVPLNGPPRSTNIVVSNQQANLLNEVCHLEKSVGEESSVDPSAVETGVTTGSKDGSLPLALLSKTLILLDRRFRLQLVLTEIIDDSLGQIFHSI